jgi:hypothetical protein
MIGVRRQRMVRVEQEQGAESTGGPMSQSFSLQSHVDAALLDRVESECDAILWHQRQRYNQHWYQSRQFTRVTTGLRIFGLVVSGLGIAVSLYYLVCRQFLPQWLFLVFFVLAGIFFLFLPKLQARIVRRMQKAGRPACRRMARRYVGRARKRAPFEAEYTIRGDLVSCYREKDGLHKQAWSRRIRGYVFVGEHVALVFRKPSSLFPRMLILGSDPEALAAALDDLGIEHGRIDATGAVQA